MRILGISGSLRGGSHNTKLLRAAAELLPPGAELVIYDDLASIPPFDEDDEAAPADAVVAFREAIADADALLIATPEYNHSIPGVLKNAIDWASRPFATTVMSNEPAAVIGASTGMFGAVWAQAEMRKVLSATGARVVDRELPVGKADSALDENGRLVDEDLEALLGEILAELRGEVEARREALAQAA
jgi:chromate reductase